MAVDEDCFRHGLPSLLAHQVMVDAMGRDCRVFDMNPSGGHEGSDAFKKSFGAELLPAPVLKTTSLRAELIRGVSRLAQLAG